MRSCDRILFTPLGIATVMMLAGTAVAADKATEAKEKYWNPLTGGNAVQADVPEVEPNNSLATAQKLECGDVLRPASIGAAADTDYVEFNVTAGTLITVGTDADGTTGQVGDTRIRLFDESGVVLASDDDSGPGLYSLLTFTATYTGTYYVGFAAYGTTSTGSYKGFVTCSTPQPPPVNDVCAGALPIECGSINDTGTTQYATNDYTLLVGGCTGYTAAGKDVVYVIQASGGDQLDAYYTTVADGSIYLITDCSNPAGRCVAGADAALSGGTEHLTYAFTASGTYYLVLDSYGTDTGGAFTLTGSYICPATEARRKTWGSLKSIYR